MLAALSYTLSYPKDNFAALSVQKYSVDYVIRSSDIRCFIQFTLVAHNLRSNQYHKSFSFGIDPFFKVISVQTPGNEVEYKVNEQNHSITLEFKKGLIDGDKAKVEIVALIRPRREAAIFSFTALIPNYVENTLGRISVKNMAPGYIIYGVPYEFGKTREGYLWLGRVKNGFQGNFYYTPKKAVWSVRYSRQVYVKGSSNKLTARFLDIFEDALYQRVQLKKILSPQNLERKGGILEARFNNIKTGKRIDFNVYTEVQRNMELSSYTSPYSERQMLELSKDDRALLRKFIKEVGWKVGNATQYEKMRFLTHKVHEIMHYDYSYTGRNLSLKDIIKYRRGVCEHYAILLLKLARYFGIPALLVEGYGFSNDKKQYGWGPHSFVLAKTDGKWRYFDPTWDLFTGYIPASHIIFRVMLEKENDISVEYEYTGKHPPKIQYSPPKVGVLQLK